MQGHLSEWKQQGVSLRGVLLLGTRKSRESQHAGAQNEADVQKEVEPMWPPKESDEGMPSMVPDNFLDPG